MAERNFPVRIRIGVPPDGLGRRHAQVTARLDEICGSNGWAMTPSGMRGVPNDAISIYYACGPRERLRGPMVRRVPRPRWLASRSEARRDEPAPRVGAGLHRTP
jgi:hypothetical protein